MPRAAWQGACMAEIVNLNRERKRRTRQAEARTAAQNRVVHGQPRAERLTLEQATLRRAALLDGARLDGARMQDSTQLESTGPIADLEGGADA